MQSIECAEVIERAYDAGQRKAGRYGHRCEGLFREGLLRESRSESPWAASESGRAGGHNLSEKGSLWGASRASCTGRNCRVTAGLVLSGGLCSSRNGDGFQNVDSLQDLEVAAEVNLDRLNRA
ncbi:hypothetical protein ILYODFUR_006689 [Ilyodon furcidens]|uniref:Uncharacterized protein n=1 Tax=Ilyodon furcidens TaxID=33524 RepID=A0ABV0T9H8_9TELE